MKRNKFFRHLGPGLITGISDNDPSGIATCAQSGAKFGFGQLWSVLLMLPLMIAIQEMCARIGAVKNRGISSIIKKHYGNKILIPLAFLLFTANTINLGADLGAMSAALSLLIPVNQLIGLIFFTGIILFCIIYFPYKRYVQILKWLCLFILVYPISLFIVRTPWLEVLKNTFVPNITFSSEYFFMLTALFGTSISPYMFIWEASQEAEENRKMKISSSHGFAQISNIRLNSLKKDNFIGMFFSQICTWSIIALIGITLHTHGISNINTAADAAKALEPIVDGFPYAGYVAKLIFSLGIIGLGLLSIPILAVSSAYALAVLLNRRSGLFHKCKNARYFYLITIVSTLIGLFMNLLQINLIKGLIIAAVINCIVALPLIFIILLITNNKQIMGEYKNKLLSNVLGWITFLLMAISSLLMFYSFFFS
ncbi:divalent metal cation transporter [Fluoribacter dumoffii]|nr:divalent metal cation transporter [Fluoribacter dumoffii]MCW8418512.1 divalent metal cation transporter [Fluoribacter dumoffii]MCW8453646.1 divalent metal cation transporter [Fluoribacter dumoffii]MCW8459136.1 divalent metal cation transporter [Fluoribacter dumoffii]MCW8482495.1 divalent metal cation transporter [Fluoribacter dumoffii]